MNKNIYSLSDDLSLEELENIYYNVVLKQDFYDDDYGNNWEITPYKDLSKILKNIFSPKQHLDIGCGTGLLVQAMMDLGITSYGIDFSQSLISKANKKIQKNLTCLSVENFLKQTDLAANDLITFTEVFEHLPISTLEQNLKLFTNIYNGNLFITIPSYGVDSNLKLGIQVSNENLQWIRDMTDNIPFKNIVLEDGLPHYGHITLASYRWWSEFFLFHGYSRHRDLEKACVEHFYSILEKYNWHPYILSKIPSSHDLAKCLKTGFSLGEGWHHYENFAGRWTDGNAKVYICEQNFQPNNLRLNLSLPEINYIQEFNLTVTIDNLVKTNDYKFKWIKRFVAFSNDFNLRGERLDIIVKFVEIFVENNKNEVASDCWRINIISPHFCPDNYGFSEDSRRLGVIIHSMEFGYSGINTPTYQLKKTQNYPILNFIVGRIKRLINKL